MQRRWPEVITTLRGYGTPAALACADLAEGVRMHWEATVAADTWSIHGLGFWRIGDDEDSTRTVRVTWEDETFAVQLIRDDRVITADRTTGETAPAVLEAFLMQLTAA